MTTTIDITPLIEVLLTLLGAIIARYAVPYFKAMLTNAQQEHVREMVHIAVYAAEKLYGSGYGQEKLNYAVEILKAHGIVLDKERLNAYIDEAIKEMEQSSKRLKFRRLKRIRQLSERRPGEKSPGRFFALKYENN